GPVDQHLLPTTVEVEGQVRALQDVRQPPTPHGLPGDGPVNGTTVHVSVAQPGRKAAGDRALAGTCWPVDRNHREAPHVTISRQPPPPRERQPVTNSGSDVRTQSTPSTRVGLSARTPATISAMARR